MAYPIGRQESYDSLRPYLPQDAQRVLDKEIPRIRKQIDSEIDDFVKSLGSYLKDQVDAETKSIGDEASAAMKKLDSILADVSAAGGDPQKLAAATADLKTAIKAYQDKWENMGKSVQKVALLAAKSMGIPIPG